MIMRREAALGGSRAPKPRSPPRSRLLLLGAPARGRQFVLDRLGARREIPGAAHRGGGRLAGFEIRLAPGAITYWRDPGDAGLPPTLDFSASENVASVGLEFPAPKRITEADGGEAFGYDGGVIFPLRVKPRDPAKPATLRLNADFAVCEKVCLPAKARLTLTLPRGRHLPTRARSTPRSPPCRARFSRRSSARSRRSAPDRWRLCAPHQDGPAARPVRRAARGLVDEGRARAWRRSGQDCFTLTRRRQAEGRRAPRLRCG